MRIVIAGGTGFLGRPLCEGLAAGGHEVVVLSRSAQDTAPTVVWSGARGPRTFRWSGGAATEGWGHLLDGADAVVNLAGESIAGRRWTPAQKARLENSRFQATRALVEVIGAAARPPGVFLSASAVGYYGSRGEEVLTESSPAGDDFLARLAVKWEAEAARAASPRTRVVVLRTGVVLERDGGVLGKLLLPFRLGLGGPVGSGRQFMSWIHRADWAALVLWLLTTDVSGPFNATAPEPVTNAEFGKALGAALKRPAFLPLPSLPLKLALGEMADALLLSGQRAVPERALGLGFTFRYRTLQDALKGILG